VLLSANSSLVLGVSLWSPLEQAAKSRQGANVLEAISLSALVGGGFAILERLTIPSFF
jgi:hypothetical protein